MSVDLNAVDTIDQLTTFQIQTEKIIDREELGEINDKLKDQYIDLNNLGINLLNDVGYEFKIILFENLLEYCQSNYVNIANFDQIMSSPNKIVEVGSHLYDFICVDCYNTIIIQYLSSINCINIEQFENYFQRVLDNDISKFKVSFLKTIQNIIDNLIKLQTLDQSVKNIRHIKIY
jgi:hypothetical protein